ncbi:MAG: hypothetical protein ACREC4_07635 [Methylocella sp.]
MRRIAVAVLACAHRLAVYGDVAPISSLDETHGPQHRRKVPVSVAWQGVLPFTKPSAERWRLLRLRPKKNPTRNPRRRQSSETAIRLKIDQSLSSCPCLARAGQALAATRLSNSFRGSPNRPDSLESNYPGSLKRFCVFTKSPCIDLGGLDFGVAVSSHCASPGTPGIVADQSGNLSSLDSINIISGEGYLGTVDNGPKLGCYNQAEDHINSGSTWKLYRMEGSLSLLNPSSSIPDGFFRVTDGTPIYYSSGQDTYCQMADWQSYLWAGGSSDLSNVIDLSSVTPVTVKSGVCGFPSEYYMVTGARTTYSSNGQSAYCSFPSSRAFQAKCPC